MAYKVKFNTLALLTDGSTGNVIQFTDTVYTDCEIDQIKLKIDLHYLTIGKKVVSVIDSIEKIDGFCLPL